MVLCVCTYGMRWVEKGKRFCIERWRCRAMGIRKEAMAVEHLLHEVPALLVMQRLMYEHAENDQV